MTSKHYTTNKLLLSFTADLIHSQSIYIWRHKTYRFLAFCFILKMYKDSECCSPKGVIIMLLLQGLQKSKKKREVDQFLSNRRKLDYNISKIL